MNANHNEYAKSNPQAYTGFVIKPRTAQADGITCSITEAANHLKIPAIIERYGSWAICADGIYSLYTKCFIDANESANNNWITPLSEKIWVNVQDYKIATARAKEIL